MVWRFLPSTLWLTRNSMNKRSPFLRDQRGKRHYWIEVALSVRFPEGLLWRAGGVKIRMLLHIRVRGRVRNDVHEFVRHS